MDENILLKEISRYLETEVIAQLSSITSTFKQSLATLDWHFWKTKLEQDYEKELEWMDINWSYVYHIFEGKNPTYVAFEYCSDWRIVKIAHDLGAIFDSAVQDYVNYSFDDIVEKLRYQTNKFNARNDIYYKCSSTNSYKSLTWLLANVPPSNNAMFYLIADGIQNGSDGINDILLHHMGGPTERMQELLISEHMLHLSSVSTIENYLTKHKITTSSTLMTVIIKGIEKKLQPREFMRAVIQNIDRSLFIPFVSIGPEWFKYIESIGKTDESLYTIVIESRNVLRIKQMATLLELDLLVHFLEMIPTITD